MFGWKKCLTSIVFLPKLLHAASIWDRQLKSQWYFLQQAAEIEESKRFATIDKTFSLVADFLEIWPGNDV